MAVLSFLDLEDLSPALIRGYQRLVNAEVGGGIGLAEPVSEAGAEALLREWARPPNSLILAELDGQLLGSAVLWVRTSPVQRHVGEIRKLVVLPEARRQGLGRRMMFELERRARESGLQTLIMDIRPHLHSRPLGAQLGYREVGILEKLSRVGDAYYDIVVMQKMLT